MKEKYNMHQRSNQYFGIRQSRLLLLFCGVLLTAVFAQAQAEEILLKNGSIVLGRVSKISAEAVFVTTAKGNQSIPKANIVRIQNTPFTAEQKAQAIEALRKKKAAIALEQDQIRNIQEAKERKRREEELAAKIRKEKEEEASAAADRAAALRELVAKGQMEKPKDEPISYKDFAWRSMVLPGWGHFYLERPWFGVLYSGGAVALLLTAYERRKQALSAKTENHRDAEFNFMLAAVPSTISADLRIAYGVSANAKAFTADQHKVDQYNGALFALAVFYGVQMVHIIYNGFAWEKGLLIVDSQRKEPGRINAYLNAVPEYTPNAERKSGLAFEGGLTVHF